MKAHREVSATNRAILFSILEEPKYDQSACTAPVPGWSAHLVYVTQFMSPDIVMSMENPKLPVYVLGVYLICSVTQHSPDYRGYR